MRSFASLIADRTKWLEREERYRFSSPKRHLLCEDALVSIQNELEDPRTRYGAMVVKQALTLEVHGLKHSRGSVYAQVKRQFGFRGNKKRVLEQYENTLKEVYT